MLGLLERLAQGSAGIPAGLQVGVWEQTPGYQHQIPVVPASIVGVPTSLEVALADDDQMLAAVRMLDERGVRFVSLQLRGPKRIRRFVRGLTPTIRSYVFRSSREGASFQTIVSAAREAELLERDEFGGPKRVRTGGQYSGTSSGGRGPHRGGGSFQSQRPVHASLPTIEGGRCGSSEGVDRRLYIPGFSASGSTAPGLVMVAREIQHLRLEVGVEDRHLVEEDELRVEVLVAPRGS
ncbi:hypothetical protein H5410_005712 [Solanum commersonii]|uniref:Uncharacterized protein n=1 Tax=Solanum commersonii TaxID=4109 RepID=A0A9J6A760_SOLCO|nr:hypothetical protein H5410_005712 [Solanum commersonii]